MTTAKDFAPVFPGWNVWCVWQKKSLDFEALMVGLDRDRRLRIWVEDAVRLGATDASVADPLDLKGSQIEILPSVPAGLTAAARKEDVGGTHALLLDGPADLRTVRFFNRGAAGKLVWPHDSNYLLDRVLQPRPDAPATSGGAPSTIGGNVTKPIGEALSTGLNVLPWALSGLLAIYGLRFFSAITGRRKRA